MPCPALPRCYAATPAHSAARAVEQSRAGQSRAGRTGQERAEQSRARLGQGRAGQSRQINGDDSAAASQLQSHPIRCAGCGMCAQSAVTRRAAATMIRKEILGACLSFTRRRREAGLQQLAPAAGSSRLDFLEPCWAWAWACLGPPSRPSERGEARAEHGKNDPFEPTDR